MNILPDHIYAVATGDIVGSTTLDKGDRERLRDVMRQAGDTLRQLWPDTIPLPVALFAGDRWQFLTTTPAAILRPAIHYRAALIASELKVDTRISFGVGTVDYIPDSNLPEGEGPAFRRSGRPLDTMGKLGLLLSAGDDRRASGWNAALRMLDAVIRHQWTPARARAVTGANLALSQEQVGQLWSPPITQQSVADHLAAAEWKAIDDVLIAFETDWARQAE